MTMTKKWKIALVLFALLLAAVVFFVATSPSGYSKNDPNVIKHWKTTAYSADANKIVAWRTIWKRPAVVQSVDGIMNCYSSSVQVTGTNYVGTGLVWGVTSAHWCGTRPGDPGPVQMIGDPTWDHHSDTAGWSLWGIDKANDQNVGPNCGWSNTYNMRYCYNRHYFAFRRGIYGVAQTVNPWVAMTVRANGSCTADKFQTAGTIGC